MNTKLLLVCSLFIADQAHAQEAKKVSLQDRAKELLNNDFAQGFAAGLVAQAVVESVRNNLPEYPNLYAQTGICRDRLTAYGIASAAFAGLHLAKGEAKNNKLRIAGVIAGAVAAATARKLALGDAHAFVK